MPNIELNLRALIGNPCFFSTLINIHNILSLHFTCSFMLFMKQVGRHVDPLLRCAPAFLRCRGRGTCGRGAWRLDSGEIKRQFASWIADVRCDFFFKEEDWHLNHFGTGLLDLLCSKHFNAIFVFRNRDARGERRHLNLFERFGLNPSSENLQIEIV